MNQHIYFQFSCEPLGPLLYIYLYFKKHQQPFSIYTLETNTQYLPLMHTMYATTTNITPFLRSSQFIHSIRSSPPPPPRGSYQIHTKPQTTQISNFKTLLCCNQACLPYIRDLRWFISQLECLIVKARFEYIYKIYRPSMKHYQLRI